ncbi:MAG: alkaline phosphatase family protein, partial [Candidatus Cybelea sp.]
MRFVRSYALVLSFGVSACSQSSSVGTLPGSLDVPAVHSVRLGSQSHKNRAAQSPIQHVVIIVQENRSVDNLFQFLPNINVRSYGRGPLGNGHIKLQSESLTAAYDVSHSHQAWLTEYDNSRMDGFGQASCKGTCPNDAAYAYVPQSDVQPYYTLAETYTFADKMFETD